MIFALFALHIGLKTLINRVLMACTYSTLSSFQKYIFTVGLHGNTDTNLECSFTDLQPLIHAALHITYKSLPLKPTSVEPKHM